MGFITLTSTANKHKVLIGSLILVHLDGAAIIIDQIRKNLDRFSVKAVFWDGDDHSSLLRPLPKRNLVDDAVVIFADEGLFGKRMVFLEIIRDRVNRTLLIQSEQHVSEKLVRGVNNNGHVCDGHLCGRHF